jgi:hypothetical protein
VSKETYGEAAGPSQAKEKEVISDMEKERKENLLQPSVG